MKQIRMVLLILSVIFFLLNFIDYNINEDHSKPVIHEKFDPSLRRLNSLLKLVNYTDSVTGAKHIQPGTMEYAIEAKNIVSKRFYHKYAAQNLNENWIAAIAQNITGLYLSSKITADDILTRPYGYCGQVNYVLMVLLEMKNYECRVVYFPHHFAMQCKIGEHWCYFDPDQEPDILPEQRYDTQWLHSNVCLAEAYKADTFAINKSFGLPIQIRYGKINEIQGPHAQVFQRITKVLSRIAFAFPLVCFVYLTKKKKPLLAASNT